jgi:hypothetical protein
MIATTDITTARRALDSAVAHRRDAVRSGRNLMVALAAEKAASAAYRALTT